MRSVSGTSAALVSIGRGSAKRGRGDAARQPLRSRVVASLRPSMTCRWEKGSVHMTDPLFRVENSRCRCPTRSGRSLLGRRPMVEDPARPRASTSRRAASSASSANPARERSTLGRTLVRLLEPAAGTIRFAGRDISHLDEAALRPLRRDLQVIFQDPLSSLNPRLTIGTIIGAPAPLPRLAGAAREARSLARGGADDRSACRRASPGAIRTSFPAGSGSASASPARSR